MSYFSAALLCLLSAVPSKAETVKFATLAPEGSTWMKVVADLDKQLQRKSSGALKFKFYPGGVSGDEKDVVRKMRMGQLHAAGVTGVGLGSIAPELRVLDAPFLFKDSSEVDYILKRFGGEFASALEAKGYVLLGWAEVGWVHLFTRAQVSGPTDLRSVKMWVWEGDPIAEAAFEALGVRPIPLSIADVMTSLETGLVDGVYGSPMAVVALQWFTKTKHVHAAPLANAMGAVLLTKKLYDSLPPDQGKLLLELSRPAMERLTKLSREENRQAMEALQKQGLKLARPSAQALKEYEEAGRQARRALAGKLYSAELLDRVEKALEYFRTSRHGKNTKD